MATDKKIRQKAIECVSNITSKCRETPCKHCTGFEDCKQIQQTQCPYPKEIWSYEHGFADGVEEERRRIYEEYQKAVKADNEANIHVDVFSRNVERFWQQMKGE